MMADRTGQQLGNYRIVRLLGRGGFAEVYLGEHVHLKTKVAIKILQTRVSNEDDMKGFLQEARTIARLVHPNIVRVTDFGVDGQTPYLVMDYAANGTLRQRHPKGAVLPVSTIATYVKQIAAALQHAHDEKLVHRDVKPENMLLGHSKKVLLSDFGIAIIAQSSRYQRTQEVAGTIAYMAPEQLYGRPLPSSDQYALGVVIYEWLTGEYPFQGSFPELASQHLVSTPPRLYMKVPGIAPGIDEVVQRALAKDPQQRFPRVEAFATAFEQACLLGKPLTPIVINPATPPLPPSILVADAPRQTPTPPPLLVQPSASDDGKENENDESTFQAGDNAVTGILDNATSKAKEEEASSSEILHGHLYDQPYKADPTSSSASSQDSGLPALFRETGKTLTNLFSRKREETQQKTRLSLFAIARADLETDERAIVGNIYKVEAGISRRRLDHFQGKPFQVTVENPYDLLLFNILLHPSDNIELLAAWYYRLPYDPRNLEPQFIVCPFRLRAPGQSSLLVNFYRERQWLKTIHFVFEGVQQPMVTSAGS